MKPDKFYIVSVVIDESMNLFSQEIYLTLAEAETEAKRLATKHKNRAYILNTLKSFEVSGYKETDCRPNSDEDWDLPFSICNKTNK